MLGAAFVLREIIPGLINVVAVPSFLLSLDCSMEACRKRFAIEVACEEFVCGKAPVSFLFFLLVLQPCLHIEFSLFVFVRP